MGDEVDSCRPRLAGFCVGYGLDIGFGGNPINESSIRIDKVDGTVISAGGHWKLPSQLVGDCSQLQWFRDGCLDYVFSSHCLEDIQDLRATVKEWLRVIRPHGMLVLFLPDEITYVMHCLNAGAQPNGAHKHPDLSIATIRSVLASPGMPKTEEVHVLFPVPENSYSFDFVVRKVR